MAEKKNGSGVVFPNDRKKEEKHPDMTGSLILLDGTEVWISAWNKLDRNQKPYMSLAIQEKQQR